MGKDVRMQDHTLDLVSRGIRCRSFFVQRGTQGGLSTFQFAFLEGSSDTK